MGFSLRDVAQAPVEPEPSNIYAVMEPAKPAEPDGEIQDPCYPGTCEPQT